MRRYGYVRVSTEHQTNDPQILALRQEGLADGQITQDVISGGVPALQRPGLSTLLKSLRSGDCLIAARLDRLGRDTLDVIGLIRILNERDIKLRIINIGVETDTPNGRLFLTILAGFSEFEKEIIRERTIAGLAAAREAGVRLGRKPKLTAVQKSHVRMLAATGQTNGQIAQVMGVPVSLTELLNKGFSVTSTTEYAGAGILLTLVGRKQTVLCVLTAPTPQTDQNVPTSRCWALN